uniref:Butyrophilin subfamily 1 member A1 n=1 Tax=Pelodiscus sinensis TaxID=13735 RepID=K7FTM6_PELSI
FRVVGPDHPVPAVVGKDALLPCQLLPQMSAEDMEVRWFISLQPSEVIHLYKDRRDHEEQQNVGFRGRTELLKDDIANGSVALRIHSITPTDEGLYSCFFQSSTFYAEAKLELTVAGLGSAPHIFIEGYQDGGIRFVCQSSGWYPEPKMQWKDRHGQLLKSSSEETSRQPDGLFQTQISIVVAENSNGNMSCCVRNPRLNIEKESVIHIADLFFPRTSPWMVTVIVILVILASIILPASFYFWNHRKKSKNKKKSKAESDPKSSINVVVLLGKLLAELGWSKVRQYAVWFAPNTWILSPHPVVVTMDPNTASSRLYVPEDGKSVKWRVSQPDVPDNPERFDCETCVLGCEGITAGRHYWEAEVGQGRVWAVGVANKSVRRKGWIKFSPEEGIWAMDQCGGHYRTCTNPENFLSIKVIPKKIGVFLDYEAGWVSFYDGVNEAPIYRFTDTFTETVFPFF